MDELTEKELSEEAQRLIEALVPNSKGATVLGLFGELGAGKTTFVQALAKALGITETVTSPTFVIEKIYRLTRKPFERLIHIDAYRLESERELVSLGWEDFVKNPKHLIVVEWADKVEHLLPRDTRRVYFKVTGEDTRTISYA